MFLPSYSLPFSVSVLLMKGLLSLGLPSPAETQERWRLGPCRAPDHGAESWRGSAGAPWPHGRLPSPPTLPKPLWQEPGSEHGARPFWVCSSPARWQPSPARPRALPARPSTQSTRAGLDAQTDLPAPAAGSTGDQAGQLQRLSPRGPGAAQAPGRAGASPSVRVRPARTSAKATRVDPGGTAPVPAPRAGWHRSLSNALPERHRGSLDVGCVDVPPSAGAAWQPPQGRGSACCCTRHPGGSRHSGRHGARAGMC